MQIVLNGKETVIEDSHTILSLLQSKGITPSAVVVELNGEIPEREKWDGIIINDKDRIEVVKFMGGG